MPSLADAKLKQRNAQSTQGAATAQKKKQGDITERLYKGKSVTPVHNSPSVPALSRRKLSLSQVGMLRYKLHRQRSRSAGNIPDLGMSEPQVANGIFDSNAKTPAQEQSTTAASGTASSTTLMEKNKGHLVLTAPKVFWRQHLHADIEIYYHSRNELFEILVYDLEDYGKELPRLYARASDVYAANERNFDCHYRELSRMRRDLIDKARLNAAAEYIMENVEVNRHKTSIAADITESGETTSALQDHSKPPVTLSLRKYVGEMGMCCDLSCGKPLYVDPVRGRDVKHTKTRDEVQDNAHTTTNATTNDLEAVHEKLLISSDRLSEAAKFVEVANAGHPSPSGECVNPVELTANTNPNKYSKYKWLWLWGIKTVIMRLRIKKSFLGMLTTVQVMQAETHRRVEEARAAMFHSPMALATRQFEKYGRKSYGTAACRGHRSTSRCASDRRISQLHLKATPQTGVTNSDGIQSRRQTNNNSSSEHRFHGDPMTATSSRSGRRNSAPTAGRCVGSGMKRLGTAAIFPTSTTTSNLVGTGTSSRRRSLGLA